MAFCIFYPRDFILCKTFHKITIATMNKLEPAQNEQDFELLQQLENLAKVGIWEVSLIDSTLHWSTGVYAM